MPAQPYVPGPVPIFVNPDNAGPRFLGFAERGVHIENKHQYRPYHVDFGGEVAADHSYQGEEATVSADLTRWDEVVFAIIADVVGHGIASVRGVDVPGEIGTLMMFEGAAYSLHLVFPYSAKLAYAQMPSGYRFFRAFLDQESLPERGAKPSTLRLSWHCVRLLNMGFVNAFGKGSLGLYDHDMTGVSLASIT